MAENQVSVRTGYRAIENQVFVYDANRLNDISPDFFELTHWQQQGAVAGEASGRGTTFFVSSGNDQFALRHYMRGGVVGRFVKDSYRYSELTGTRAWQEWHLLMRLYNEGLPVCKPVAGRIIRLGQVYKADLATLRIPAARSWYDWMVEGVLPGEYWVALGKLLRKFHKAGVYHHDLNVRNILRTEDGQLYLIDFDKARIRKAGAWQRGNLARLRRSIDKLQGQGNELHFSESSWGQLMQGYSSSA